MTRDVLRSSISVRDVIEIADHIAASNLGAALRFLDAAEETYAFLAANQEVGHLCDINRPEMEGLRVWRIHGFPNHLVYFRQTIDSVIVERVLHAARDADAIFGKSS
jgi:toxin ParE1/3/4